MIRESALPAPRGFLNCEQPFQTCCGICSTTGLSAGRRWCGGWACFATAMGKDSTIIRAEGRLCVCDAVVMHRWRRLWVPLVLYMFDSLVENVSLEASRILTTDQNDFMA